MWASYIVLLVLLHTALANGPTRASAVADASAAGDKSYVNTYAAASNSHPTFNVSPATSTPPDNGAKFERCPVNETHVPCKTGCPTNYCPKDDSRGIVACSPPHPCPAGCVCKGDYLRLSTKHDRCVLARECLPVNCTRPNEEWNPCPSVCLVESCEAMDRPQKRCDKPYSYCRPQCVCNQGYFRNQDGICVLASQCPRNCCVSVECRRTCSNPNPPNCPYEEPSQTNIDGCQCKSGYILSKIGGKCIKIEDCPKGCNYDPHAVAKECPVPCPATCDMPEPMLTCKRKCDPIGCECEPGYILSDGKCILPDDCKGGNPCGETGIFSSCKSYCPYDYCPVDDRREAIVCEFYPFSPCYPGCICKTNYKRKSYDDNRCILSSECPPVECTRQNEEWNSCPKDPLMETCEDVDRQVSECNKRVLNCQPKCVCMPDTYRNKSDICISADDCRQITASEPVCGYNEIYTDRKPICPPESCEISYTEYSCIPPFYESGCACIKDHLRNKSGICIPNDECPAPVSCPIPSECRPTCAIRNPKNCTYTEPSDSNLDGCQCKEGYILSESEGKCIKIEDCPLPKCGYNETPSTCKIICPPQKCGVNPALVLCQKFDCEPGCNCIKDHVRNASGICIPSDQCLPECGDNETPALCKKICPPQQCGVNPALIRCKKPDCEPGCDCIEGYLRNANGICIPSNKCSNCSIPRECRATCAVPNPKNCPYTEPPASNIDGCECQKGYVLSKPDGKCVRVDECPQDIGCNGDAHAIIKECPWPCPSTCDAPNTIQCRKACNPIGCQCKPGYLLSSINGKCILPNKCKNGNPCGVNGTFSDCGFRCPNQYCPADDDLTEIACKPGRPCPPGCLCKDNYKRNNYQENFCILASDCSPVKCTRPNEVWNSCPKCPGERCENRNMPCEDPSGTNCQPKCVCSAGYCRDKDNACVKENYCYN